MSPSWMISLFIFAVVAVSPCRAIEPSVAVVETIPVGNGESILINIEEGPETSYNVQVGGSPVPVKIRPLVLTTGDPGNTQPLTINNLTLGADRVPVPIFLRNLTRSKLRVTLQQPEAPENATKEEKARFCTPTCKLDPEQYTPFCTPDSKSTSRCKPAPGALATCGSTACEAIRKGCDKANCTVDLYKALEACSCSVSKTLEASTFPLPGSAALKASRYVPNAIGEYSLQTPAGLAPVLTNADRTIAAANVGTTNFKFEQVADDEVERDYPTVLFDAALFSAKTGVSMATDVYRFLIEHDPAAPVENETLAKAPTTTDFGGALAVPITVAASPTLTANQTTGQPMRVVVVPLDDTGVASWRYLNPRNPACINCRPGGLPVPPAEAPAGVVFRNRTQDRTFLISITLPATVATTAVEETFKCTAGQPCKITRAVAPYNTVLFDSSILSLFPKSLIKFEVSLYGETATLGNAAAYLSLANPFDEKGKSALTERASNTGFKTRLSLSGRVDPDFRIVPTADVVKAAVEKDLKDLPPDPNTPEEIARRTSSVLAAFLCTNPDSLTTYKPDNEPSICAEHPYVDGNTQAYRGSGSINFTANLSDRADGSATLSFRDGNYGAEIDKTTVSEYNVTIYGVNGLSLKFGKADFLIPSNGIAIAESGEGFLYSWRFLGLGHVIRRESTAGAPQQTNQDRKDWFLQARSLSLGQRWREEAIEYDRTIAAYPGQPINAKDPGRIRRMLSVFRSADLYVVRGEDKLVNSTYTTGGAEVFFARPGSSPSKNKDGTLLRNIFSGSIAAYQSRKEVDKEDNCDLALPAPRVCNGSGHVWLLTVTWTPSMLIATGTNAATSPHTVSLAIGQGTGNKPGTNRDEGYIGEPAFSPDKLFLKTFSPKMNSKGVQYVPIGLSNKRYTALTYTNSKTSIFDFVASLLEVENDVNSRSTVVALREYKLRYSENGARAAAREVNVTFNIEIPKGVTFSFDVNFLDPSEAFENRIKERAWSFGANVTLSL